MKFDKTKANPMQLMMYGVLLLFTIIIVAAVVTQSFSNQPSTTALRLTATQQAITQAADNVAGPSRNATASANAGSSAGGTTSATQGTQVSGTGTAGSSLNTPEGGGTPPDAGSVAGPTQISTSADPPSALTPPPTMQTTATEIAPPAIGTPPPTLRVTQTQIGPPPNGSPPPTLQRTPTQGGPPSGLTPPPTALPLTAGTYNDTHIAWQYGAGWAVYNGSGPYQNDFHYTGTVGSYVELSFTGTGFSLVYTATPTRGLIDVYIDGNKVGTINAYNNATVWQSTWASATLPNGTHTVRFVHAGGGSDKNIDVDAITILP